jgi:hypothetical protein
MYFFFQGRFREEEARCQNYKQIYKNSSFFYKISISREEFFKVHVVKQYRDIRKFVHNFC